MSRSKMAGAAVMLAGALAGSAGAADAVAKPLDGGIVTTVSAESAGGSTSTAWNRGRAAGL